ncbi:MAG: exodeoxyribonuclease V subunit beta [Burkholderiales bacterium]|nr:exodeoxyribonuclease V subunit beta [Burkholderiales bacterium]
MGPPAMSDSSNALNPLTLPLHGSRLIEASAGTGKTWTIAALYLRLVLGHGGAAAYARPLLPSEILVLTFTRAATRELSDRIRARLVEAARCFRGEAAPADALLAGLLDAYADGGVRTEAAWRLALAAEAMDEAAVHTIDAWCQRMLREHAFDSASAFDEELAADESVLRREAALDIWRQQVLPLAGDPLDAVLGVWPDAEALVADAQALLRQGPIVDEASQGLGEVAARLAAARRDAVAAIKDGWTARAQSMRDWLDGQYASKSCAFSKKSLQARHYRAWLDALAAWAADPAVEQPKFSTKADRLTPARMAEIAVPPGRALDLPPAFAAFAQLLADLAALPAIAAPLRLNAAAAISARLALLKRRAARFGFADLLERLDAALDPAAPTAERLRERILAQHPVALVDEFQDTSPIQARIFDRLYRCAADDPATALLLIGDPKQSIYAFRGADIQSYLRARRATAGRHERLATNHRSTAELVDAVNHLFGIAEARPGPGAFLFRHAGDDPLPYVPVGARGRDDVFVTAAGRPPALTFELDATLRDGTSSRRLQAARSAERIAVLLADEQAGFDAPGQPRRRLRPADIAVLVREGREAAAVRRELRRRGVAAVYLSDRDSVYASGEARDLLRWLEAVAAPRDARLARAAWATRLAGLTLAELLRLSDDDLEFDARVGELQMLQGIWKEQGVLTMLRRTVQSLDLPARWRAADPAPTEGERRLTNLLHLAELLQAASAGLEGEEALIRWLGRQIDGGESGDEQILRLESDADRVQIITIHKSKGLEYPLVFLPFASAVRRGGGAASPVLVREGDDGRRRLVVDPGADDLEAERYDALRESTRLLYVALTRARHALWVGLAALRSGASDACAWSESAIGRLLGGEVSPSPEELPARLRQGLAPCAAIDLVAAPDDIACTRVPTAALVPLRDDPPYAADFDRDWSVGSYSGLVRGIAALPAEAVRDDEPAGPVVAVTTAAGAASAAPRHAFPRGPLAGNFLHDQLEWLAGEGFGLEDSPLLQQQLLRRCERQGWGAHGDGLVAWLGAVLRRPLPGPGCALRELAAPEPEMEFWFPTQGLQARHIDRLCRDHLPGPRERPPLPERELHGMLMGFADLVFERGGRYWVLDYKSNHLGMRDADYDAAALAGAMGEHRYDVQAALYLLALHRLLRSRLGAAYDPARQLGGAIYLFLRGIDGPEAGCFVVPAVPALLEALDAAVGSSATGRGAGR